MNDILQRLLEAKAKVLARDRAAEPWEALHERALARMGERRSFAGALRAPGAEFAIVAEIKRASPSLGLIVRDFDPARIAAAYEAAGADAISVLTESDHFLGELGFLDVVRANSTRPILRKDFLTEAYQVAQSAACGADAILLIVAALDDERLAALIREAARYRLDALVEVHDAAELERALRAGARIVGINNRNLRTFLVDLAVTEELLPAIPADVLVVSESGFHSSEQLARLRDAGARAFLIGESLMRSSDPTAALRELRGRGRVQAER
ncbi:MAG TPA: indole-3-glycerol phosphate synthase TrpC [Candidatus Dormibacteraeota bacterium]|nr:indole-3-glycerol phosphate synthase TrpC [Candidatus Dormibacteraeota bacterium]